MEACDKSKLLYQQMTCYVYMFQFAQR
uniref:Uncharacterized protein n=1 Tax=Arundo donax TaxID=35708 RepID=A0A0A9A6P4_ARUDO